MVRCYIALGSNQAQPLQQVETAVEALAQLPESRLVAVSRWYQSAAVGPGRQPDYVNGVAAIDTDLSPLDLLTALQGIENRQGRVRHERWGPRTLDLDLLLYGGRRIDLPELTVPHPRMLRRPFVLQPLLDIAPGLRTLAGTPIVDIATYLGSDDLRLVGSGHSPTISPDLRRSGTPPPDNQTAGDSQ